MRLPDHWAVRWMWRYFLDLYYKTEDVAGFFEEADAWADAVARGIADRIPWWELRSAVRDRIPILRELIDDYSCFLREYLGRSLGLPPLEYETWDMLVFWTFYRSFPLLARLHTNFWQVLKDEVREYSPDLWGLMDDPSLWLREFLGEHLSLHPLEYETWDMLWFWAFYQRFPFLARLYTNPWETIKGVIEDYAPSLAFLIEDPRGWLRELLRSWDEELVLLLDDPSGFVMGMIDRLVERRLEEFSEKALSWTERILLYLW